MDVSLNELIPPPTEVIDTHKVYSIAAACIVLAFTTTLICGTRLVYRYRKNAFGADDYALIPALVLYIGWTILAVHTNLNGGLGKPLEEITIPEYEVDLKGLTAATWLYPVMSASIRISIVFFYIRIFGQGHRRFLNGSLRAFLVLQAVYIIAFSIVPAFTCRPIYYAWQLLGRDTHCDYIFYNDATIALYSVSLAFDVLLLLFPIVPVSRLQLPIKKRFGIGVIFVLGAASSVATAYKLGVWVAQESRTQTANPHWFDYLMSRYIPVQYDSHGVTIWIPSQVEPTVALIGASLPAVYQLFTITIKEYSQARTRGSRSNRSQSEERPEDSHGSLDRKYLVCRGDYSVYDQPDTELRGVNNGSSPTDFPPYTPHLRLSV